MTVLKQFALSREKAEMSIFSETTCKRKGQLEVPARAILLSLFCTIKEFPTKYLYALHCVPLRGTTIQMCDNGNYSGTFLAPPAANTIQIRVTLSSNRRILAPPYERGFFLFKWYWPPAAALEKEGDFARTPRAPAGGRCPSAPPLLNSKEEHAAGGGSGKRRGFCEDTSRSGKGRCPPAPPSE